jgi:transcriptional regulator with XRE-family HTH domain
VTAEHWLPRVETFGQRLRRLRKTAGLTPSALAHAVSVTEGAIPQMETGTTKRASFITGLRIAAALGVMPWYLATGEERDDQNDAIEVLGLRTLLERLECRVRELEEREATIARPMPP